MTTHALMMRFRTIPLHAGGRRFTSCDLHRSFMDEILKTGPVVPSVERLGGQARGRTTQRYDRRGEHAKRRAAGNLHVPYGGAT